MPENRLLQMIPADLQEQILPALETVELKRGEVLMERGQLFDQIYFPTGALVSLVSDFSDGSRIEAMVVGYDGFVGIPAVLGTNISPLEAMVQIPGEAKRVEVRHFYSLLIDAHFRDLVNQFVAKTIAVLAQSIGCAAFHPVEQRLARWLLMVQDAIEQDELSLTHEFIGMMLGRTGQR